MSTDNCNKWVLGNSGEGLSLTAAGVSPGTFHTMILGSSGRGRSLLTILSAAQRQELDVWTKTQPRRDGIIDLMNWPGWAELALSKPPERASNAVVLEGMDIGYGFRRYTGSCHCCEWLGSADATSVKDATAKLVGTHTAEQPSCDAGNLLLVF